MAPAEPLTVRGTDELAVLDGYREQAIAATGWGASVQLFQRRNLAFWTWAALVTWGALSWLQNTIESLNYLAPAITVSSGVFAVYGVIFWWFTQRIDRYAAQPTRLRLAAFAWGAFAATMVLSLPANTAIGELLAKHFGQLFANTWTAALSAPLVEEWSKGLGLVLLVSMAPHVVCTAFDGFILGAFLGLGFQILEDIHYAENAAAANFGVDQLGSIMKIFILRTSTGVAGHILYSAIFCTGLAYLVGLSAQPRKIFRGLGLIITAMGLHFLWNGMGALPGALFGEGTAAQIMMSALLILLPVTALVICGAVFRHAVAGERGFIRYLLAPEQARGVVTEAELAAVAGTKKERKCYLRSGGSPGRRRRPGRRGRGQVLTAVFDLVNELGTADGATTKRVAFARSEVMRLRAKGHATSRNTHAL